MSADPRIANVLRVFDLWQKTKPADCEPGRYMETVAELIDWSTVSRETLVALLTSIAAEPDSGELLEDLNKNAEDEYHVYLQCTIGNEITERLEAIGLNGYQAEQIAHQAIDTALEQSKLAAKAQGAA